MTSQGRAPDIADRLSSAVEFAQRWAPMDRTNRLHIETYPHIADEEFAMGQMCFEVGTYANSEKIEAIGRSVDEAVDRFLVKAAEWLERRADRRDHTATAERDGAAYDRAQAEQFKRMVPAPSTKEQP